MKNAVHTLLVAIKWPIKKIVFSLMIIAAFCCAFIARSAKRPIDVGIGPEPLINNIIFKEALTSAGYTAETFVNCTYFITTNFDIKYTPSFFGSFLFSIKTLFKYKALYIYFSGGPFAWAGMKNFEPLLYKIAKIKVCVFPYGSDCQDMRFCRNKLFLQAMATEYPNHTRNADAIQKRLLRWTHWADIVFASPDLTDYISRWDFMVMGYALNTRSITPNTDSLPGTSETITILHAPNHKAIKGTRFFETAVNELQKEGYPVRLQIIQKMPNSELLTHIKNADIIADQLVIGWFGYFALEGLAAGKPVLCYLRQDLLDLVQFAGIVKEQEIPLINCTYKNVKDRIRELLDNSSKLKKIGRDSRVFVEKHHSIESFSQILLKANLKMGLPPSSI